MTSLDKLNWKLNADMDSVVSRLVLDYLGPMATTHANRALRLDREDDLYFSQRLIEFGRKLEPPLLGLVGFSGPYAEAFVYSDVKDSVRAKGRVNMREFYVNTLTILDDLLNTCTRYGSEAVDVELRLLSEYVEHSAQIIFRFIANACELLEQEGV